MWAMLCHYCNRRSPHFHRPLPKPATWAGRSCAVSGVLVAVGRWERQQTTETGNANETKSGVVVEVVREPCRRRQTRTRTVLRQRQTSRLHQQKTARCRWPECSPWTHVQAVAGRVVAASWAWTAVVVSQTRAQPLRRPRQRRTERWTLTPASGRRGQCRKSCHRRHRQRFLLLVPIRRRGRRTVVLSFLK